LWGDEMSDNSYQINRLDLEIDTLTNQISNNNVKIERLRNAFERIVSSQSEFMSNKRRIHLPQLTSSTWAGRHADEFSDIRQDVDDLYSKIGENNIEDTLNYIESKIEYYEGLNGSISSEITYNRQRISHLRDEE
jgi:prefoldin subunit 5